MSGTIVVTNWAHEAFIAALLSYYGEWKSVALKHNVKLSEEDVKGWKEPIVTIETMYEEDLKKHFKDVTVLSMPVEDEKLKGLLGVTAYKESREKHNKELSLLKTHSTRPTDESSRFVLGIEHTFDPEAKDLGLLECYLKYLDSGLVVDKIIKSGTSIQETQAHMALKRCRNSAFSMISINGYSDAKYPCVKGTDLVGEGHKALHKLYPESPVTIVLIEDWNGRVSVNTWGDAKENAMDILGILCEPRPKHGGNAKRGGGTRKKNWEEYITKH